MNLRRCLILFPLVLLGATLEQAAPPTTTGNVTIQLPAGWLVQTGTGRTVLTARTPQPDKDAGGQFQAMLTITQDAGNNINPDVLKAQLAKEPNYKSVEDPNPVVVNGMQGVRFAGVITRGTLQLYSRQYMFVVNKQIYVITFTSLSSLWQVYQQKVEASIATFTVKK